MKINWGIRLKNPVFWANLAMAVVLPVFTYLGLSWQDISSWNTFGDVLVQAAQNPVILVSVLVSAWNLINDPTTVGLSDSTRALRYKKPMDSRLSGLAKDFKA